MKWGPLAGALFVFSLDVRVKASEMITIPEDPEVIQEPANCIIESSICAVKTHRGRKFKFFVGAHTVVMDSDTTVLRVGDSAVRLVEGTIWVLPQGDFTVESIYGHAVSQGEEFWAMAVKNQFAVRATFSEVQLYPRGGTEVVAVPPGYQNWLGPAAYHGTAAIGIPAAMNFKSHLVHWARLYFGPKKEFGPKVSRLRDLWAEAVASAADLHLGLVQRTIASEEQNRLRRAEARREREKLDAELRALFRRKTYIDFDPAF